MERKSDFLQSGSSTWPFKVPFILEPQILSSRALSPGMSWGQYV